MVGYEETIMSEESVKGIGNPEIVYQFLLPYLKVQALISYQRGQDSERTDIFEHTYEGEEGLQVDIES